MIRIFARSQQPDPFNFIYSRCFNSLSIATNNSVMLALSSNIQPVHTDPLHDNKK